MPEAGHGRSDHEATSEDLLPMHVTTRARRRLATLAIAGVLALSLAACGDDDDDDASATRRLPPP